MINLGDDKYNPFPDIVNIFTDTWQELSTEDLDKTIELLFKGGVTIKNHDTAFTVLEYLNTNNVLDLKYQLDKTVLIKRK
jgi:hypothetical protein